MKRIKVLFGKRRMMVLLTLTVLVLAAAALVASSASFTATSANPGNVFTAGSLSIHATRRLVVSRGSLMIDRRRHEAGDRSRSAASRTPAPSAASFTLTGSIADGHDADLRKQPCTDHRRNDAATNLVTDPALHQRLSQLRASAWARSRGASTHLHLHRQVPGQRPAPQASPTASDNTFMGGPPPIDFSWTPSSN